MIWSQMVDLAVDHARSEWCSKHWRSSLISNIGGGNIDFSFEELEAIRSLRWQVQPIDGQMLMTPSEAHLVPGHGWRRLSVLFWTELRGSDVPEEHLSTVIAAHPVIADKSAFLVTEQDIWAMTKETIDAIIAQRRSLVGVLEQTG